MSRFEPRTLGRVERQALAAAFVLTIALLATACGGNDEGSSSSKQPPQAQLIAKVKPSVIQVYGMSSDEMYGGTGVIIDTKGKLAITNAHVTSGLSGTKARSGGFETSVQVVATAPCDDVALIRLASLPPRATPLEFGTAATVKAGQKVTALGYPNSFVNPATQKLNSTVGNVSVDGTVAAEPSDALPHYTSVVQHQAPIGHGSSGGPLVDANGLLLGINALANDPGETANQAYAISSERIQELLPTLRKGKSIAYVGWDLYPARFLEQEDLEILGWTLDPADEGMVVLDVDTGSNADRRDFVFGDYIERIESNVVNTMSDVCDVLHSKRGQVIEVQGRYMTAEDANVTWSEKVRVR